MKIFDYEDRDEWYKWAEECITSDEEQECKIAIHTGKYCDEYTIITVKYMGKNQDQEQEFIAYKGESNFRIYYNGNLKIYGWDILKVDRLCKYYHIKEISWTSDLGEKDFPITAVEEPYYISDFKWFKNSLSIFAKFIIVASYPLEPSLEDYE